MPDRYVARHARPRPRHRRVITGLAVACCTALGVAGVGVPALAAFTSEVPVSYDAATYCTEGASASSYLADPVQLWTGGSSWLGADQGASVTSENGSTVWLFNDTFSGATVPSGLLRNSVLVTKGSCLLYSSLDDPEVSGDFFPAPPGVWWWPTHGVRGAGVADMWVSAGSYTGGEGTWDFQHVGDALFRLDLSQDRPVVVTQVAAPEVLSPVTWSAGLARWQDRLILYGVNDDHTLYAASTPLAAPGSAWQFAGGRGQWVDSWLEALPLAQLKATSVSFFEHEGKWVGAVKPNGFLGKDVDLLVGPTPTGPFKTVTWFEAPDLGTDRWTYNPVVHQGLGRDGLLSVSVSSNHESYEKAKSSPELYRPLFMEVPLPVLN